MSTSTADIVSLVSGFEPRWHVIDADGKTLGRISSEIAVLLQGKHKPTYVSYMNTGDYVVVINAEKIRATGKKMDQKMYYRHSGYPGGLKERTLAQVLDKSPTRVIKQSVKGMLPKNKLGRKMISRLKLYVGSDHPHKAQVNSRLQSAMEKTSLAGGVKKDSNTETSNSESRIAPKTTRQSPSKSKTAKTSEGEGEQIVNSPRAKRSRAKSTSDDSEKSPAKEA